MGKERSQQNEEEEETRLEEKDPSNDEEEKGKVSSDRQEDTSAAATKRKRKRKRKATAVESSTADKNEFEAQKIDANRDSVDCTVYVEGIPFDATTVQVKDFFASNGVQDVVELRLPTWQDSGRLRGYGHVVFESAVSYEKALKLSGEYLDRRYLTIQPAKARNDASSSNNHSREEGVEPPKDCKTIFCHNLPYSATEDDVTTVFGEFGSIESSGVRIARNSVNRQSKGFAYIDFQSSSDAQAAVQACSEQRVTVGGRLVRVDYDTGRMKGSFKTESGKLWTKQVKDEKSKKPRRD
jgi:nucleolin